MVLILLLKGKRKNVSYSAYPGEGGGGGSHSLDKDAVTSGSPSLVEPFLFIANQGGDHGAFLTNVQFMLPGHGGQGYWPNTVSTFATNIHSVHVSVSWK